MNNKLMLIISLAIFSCLTMADDYTITIIPASDAPTSFKCLNQTATQLQQFFEGFDDYYKVDDEINFPVRDSIPELVLSAPGFDIPARDLNRTQVEMVYSKAIPMMEWSGEFEKRSKEIKDKFATVKNKKYNLVDVILRPLEFEETPANKRLYPRFAMECESGVLDASEDTGATYFQNCYMAGERTQIAQNEFRFNTSEHIFTFARITNGFPRDGLKIFIRAFENSKSCPDPENPANPELFSTKVSYKVSLMTVKEEVDMVKGRGAQVLSEGSSMPSWLLYKAMNFMFDESKFYGQYFEKYYQSWFDQLSGQK